jgi:hypothetical protein
MSDLLDDLEEVRRLTVRPGDVLVFRFKHALPQERIHRIGEYLKAKLGDDVKILVLDGGTSLDVLEPPR